MRRFTSLSAATALALVIGLMASPASQADEAAPEAAAVPDVPSIPAQTTSSVAEVAGLVVTTSRSTTSLEAAAADVVDGAATIDDVTAAPDGARVVAFDEPVAGDVAEQLADELADEPGVTSVEPNYVRSAADAPPVSVNDQLFPLQANLWDTSRPGGGYSTRAPAFWSTTFGSPNVRVAVLDTGKTAHPDLTWAAGWDFVDNDADPTDPGSTGGSLGDFHGTHVAGTVAARANNGIGVSGVAPGVTIIPVRVLDGAGRGTDLTIARGIAWAAGFTVLGSTNPAPAQVITMSLAGVGACTSTLANAINAARSRGVVVIAAAGNNGANSASYAPVSCAGVIGVGATDAAGARASFSNYGSAVDISAPGTQVLSTARRASDGAFGYAYQSGTSMAAPAIAGAAALLASTGMSGAKIEQTLPTRVRASTSPGTAGILDLRPRIGSKVSLKASAKKIKKGKRVVLRVKVRTVKGARANGRIRVYDGNKIIRKANVTVRRNGNITVKTPRLKRKGTHKLRVVYLGAGVVSGSKSVIRKVKVK